MSVKDVIKANDQFPILGTSNNERKKVINVKKKNRLVPLWKLGENDIANDDIIPVINKNIVCDSYFKLFP